MIPYQARTFGSILRENALQLLMYMLGIWLVALVGLLPAVIYILIAIGSNALYMYWVCPYCGHHAPGTCLAGFDLLSGRQFRRQANRSFAGQFRLGTIVVGLGWFLPPAAAVYLLLTDFSWLALFLLILFCLVAFWMLPEFSKRICEADETPDTRRRPAH